MASSSPFLSAEGPARARGAVADFPQRLFYRTVAIREGHLVSFSQIRFGDDVVDFLSGDAGAPSKEVAAAMADLKEIEEEARALGYRVPEQCAIENATHVLSSLKLPPRHPPRLTVYPFENGDVGVDAASAHTNECRVLVICAGDGSVLCFGARFGFLCLMDGMTKEGCRLIVCPRRQAPRPLSTRKAWLASAPPTKSSDRSMDGPSSSSRMLNEANDV